MLSQNFRRKGHYCKVDIVMGAGQQQLHKSGKSLDQMYGIMTEVSTISVWEEGSSMNTEERCRCRCRRFVVSFSAGRGPHKLCISRRQPQAPMDGLHSLADAALTLAANPLICRCERADAAGSLFITSCSWTHGEKIYTFSKVGSDGNRKTCRGPSSTSYKTQKQRENT